MCILLCRHLVKEGGAVLEIREKAKQRCIRHKIIDERLLSNTASLFHNRDNFIPMGVMSSAGNNALRIARHYLIFWGHN